ncbi:GntR family transcriptional regulator [Aestuariispira insulae]|uniref:Regulatory GntR family protein n=1 Tax=Aestuariispira insulae TaxID=1461337 RepID=A0A3D9H2I4_9PROT|nr:winged helix-turn-helix domain-containing protein [Aestuariispira insulae]RED43713.1 regulatory GntR family protein [Aestuariispira insulae]
MGNEVLFHLDRNKQESLQSQLRKAILNAILNGSLPAGFKLPSSRRLADDLQISRNTALIVYQHLIEDGYLEARERSGLYVNGDFIEELEHSRLKKAQPRPPVPREELLPDWHTRLQSEPSGLTFLNLPRNWRQMPYPFVYGQPDRTLFPLTSYLQLQAVVLD